MKEEDPEDLPEKAGAAEHEEARAFELGMDVEGRDRA